MSTPTLARTSQPQLLQYCCEHELHGHVTQILTLCTGTLLEPVCSPPVPHLFSGAESGQIRIWDIRLFHCVHILSEHSRPVFSLATNNDFLLSAAADNTVRVWCLRTLRCVFVLSGHAGNIFSLYVPNFTAQSDPSFKILTPAQSLSDAFGVAPDAEDEAQTNDLIAFVGCQDTSIRRIVIPAEKIQLVSKIMTNLKDFCESPRKDTIRRLSSSVISLPTTPPAYAELPIQLNTLEHAEGVKGHRGFVYALAGIKNCIISGGGDGCLKVWDTSTMMCKRTIAAQCGSIFCVATDGSRVFAAGQGKVIKVWDSDTFFARATLHGHQNEILSLAVTKNWLVSGDADGCLIFWERKTLRYGYSIKDAHKGPVLSLFRQGQMVFSGSFDHVIKIWTLRDCKDDIKFSTSSEQDEADEMTQHTDFMATLRKFISFKSVAGEPSMREDCWTAAKFARSVMQEFGFSTKMVEGAESGNPIVLGRIGMDPTKITLAFYGHYDVFPVGKGEDWKTPAFSLAGRNGYLFGRGVSDNKGPILAALFAIREVQQEDGELPINVVVILEGEEEQRSAGFREAILNNKEFLSGTDLILISNTTWIGDTTPCLHYGLRGRVDMKINISGPAKPLHSGEHGGAIVEPMIDLIHILSSLVSAGKDGKILVPNFYDDVRAVTDEEKKLYESIDFDCNEYKKSVGVKFCKEDEKIDLLMARWRMPALSVHVISSDSSTATTRIPSSSSAKVSMRIVPNQKPKKMFELVVKHIESTFAKLQSPNELKVELQSYGEYWISDTSGVFVKTMTAAIYSIWGIKPLLTRCGGTIPNTKFLEETLGAPALHLPMSQARDNAHLGNERIRIENLTNGKAVLREFIRNCGGLQKPTQRLHSESA